MGLLSDMCTSCGNRVKKAARFCSTCGSQAPEGWIRCGGCDKWVGNDSGFCPHCKHSLRPEERDLIVNGKIYRDPSYFIQRVSLSTSRDDLPVSIIVGDNCMVADPEKKGELLAPGGFFNTLGVQEVTLVSSDEVAIPVRIENVRTADGSTVSIYTETVLKVASDGAEAIAQRFLGSNRNRTLKQVVQDIDSEINEAITNVLRAENLRDFLVDPEKRLAFEKQLENSLMEALSARGLQVVRVAAPQFEGKDVAAVLQKHKSEVDLANRIAYQSRIIELNTTLEKDKVRSEQEIATLARQLAYESDLEVADVEHEVNLLKQVHRHELTEKEVAFEMKQAKVKLEEDLAARRKTLDYEVDEARQWLDVRKSKKKDDQELLFERLREFDKYDTKALLSVLPEEQGKSLVELTRIRESGSSKDMTMTPEQVQEILTSLEAAKKESEKGE